MRNDDYMRRAIELARRGEGLTSPNPMVGCVIVKDNRIVAEGWHERYGGFHAERNALLNCREDVTGAELYVTLEPCCHTGKTPPCTDIIIEKKIGKVYIGSDDPNPLVAGRGIEILKEAGIEVETHILKKECDDLNEIFFHYITTKMPFVAMKYAMTLDGKIAKAGAMESVTSDATRRTFITGPEAHAHVHSLRKRYAAILVGIGTVLADDPMLTYRGNVTLGCAGPDNSFGRMNSGFAGRPHCGPDVSESTIVNDYNPTRIILDTHGRIPLSSKTVQTAGDVPTMVVCLADSINSEKEKSLIDAGIRVLPVPPDENGRADLESVFRKLGEQGIDSILVEGGSAIHGSLLEKPHLINRVYAYIAPKLFGGATALSPAGGAGVPGSSSGSGFESGALHLTEIELIRLGEDICLTGRPS